MPIYEYQCEAGHAFEELQSLSEPPLESCTICSGQARRTISGPTQLKGAGVHLFDKRFGGRDVLHDPTFSHREKEDIASETARCGRR